MPLSARPRVAWVFLVMLLAGLACALPGRDEPAPTQTRPAQAATAQAAPTQAASSEAMPGGKIAFFFQNVGPMKGGQGTNSVRIATTCDMQKVESCSLDAVSWNVATSFSTGGAYGDPVFSRLEDGSWVMTAWSVIGGQRRTRSLIVYQGACPFVREQDTVALVPSRAAGCADLMSPSDGKTSQVVQVDGEGYLFHTAGGGIYLAHVLGRGRRSTELESLCMGQKKVSDLSQLAFGASTPVLTGEDAQGLMLSDVAIARRADGTWVLFVKGIPSNMQCEHNSLCELCARAVYRTTSTDLLHWSKLEKVVQQASVPEAVATGDGTVWLYWQDFNDACAGNDPRLGAVAPISGAYEQPGTYDLSDPIQVSFAGDAGLADPGAHPPTNGNPIYLPDEAAVRALDACVAQAGGSATRAFPGLGGGASKAAGTSKATGGASSGQGAHKAGGTGGSGGSKAGTGAPGGSKTGTGAPGGSKAGTGAPGGRPKGGKKPGSAGGAKPNGG